MRSLAQLLGLSRTTVSDALRGSPRVEAETSRRVLEAAQAAGYVFNPLISKVMSNLKQSGRDAFRGNLAAVELAEPDRPPHGIFHEELLGGARRRAEDLGFRLEYLLLGGSGLSHSRLDRVLHSRNITGLLILPAWHPPNLSGFDWSRLSAVYTGRNLEEPALNYVASDAFEAVLTALRKLAELGYRRPGLFVEAGRDALNQSRLSAAFYAFQRLHSGVEFVPALRAPRVDRDLFREWFLRHQPDVVLHEQTDAMAWMEECGARIPETHGFVCLNALYRNRPSAALDLQPREIGIRAVDLLAGQLYRNERGGAACPLATLVPAVWVAGPTVRPVVSAQGIVGDDELEVSGPACLL